MKKTVGVDIVADQNIKIDWASMTTNLANVLTQGFMAAVGITDGVGDAISALIAAAGSIKIESSIGEKAYEMSALCFAWTLDQVIPSDLKRDAKSISRDIITEIRNSIAENSVMPSTFIERPVTLPLYINLRDKFIERLVPNAGLHADMVARFDAAFSRSVFELWSKRADVLSPLLSALDAPGRYASEQIREWEAYRGSLIADFEVRPIFGQEEEKIPLSSLYVPLRVQWRINEDESKSEKKRPKVVEPDISVAMLDDVLEKWISSKHVDDVIKLIGGGPGSGKSTSMRAFARKMSNLSHVRTLFIPLQHISLDGDLRDTINKYYSTRTGSAFTHPPLSRSSIEDGPLLLLIFDGLDELSRPGEAANDVAQLFVSKLQQMLATLNSDIRQTTKVIATGRMPSFQAVKKHIGGNSDRYLEVIGYGPLVYSKISKESQAISAIDQRPIWWKKYATSLSLPDTDIVPHALSDSELASITHEPLLCYLLALSGFATNDWEAAAENRNRIYERLVDDVWSRGWGDGPNEVKRQGPGKALSKSNFNQLMDTIALAAWLGGDARVASETGFHDAVKITASQSAWEEFKSDNGEDVTNLAMNFYLKSSEIEQRGFEFTHKSFGEYLCARALLRIADELLPLVDRRLDSVMSEWLHSTSTGSLTSEILDFLRNEVRLRISNGENDDVKKLLLGFEKIVSNAIADGFPAHGNIAKSWRMAETSQRNAELAAWGILNSCLQAINYKREHIIRLGEINWTSITSLNEAIMRLGNPDGSSPFLQCLSYMDISNAELFGLNLSRANFRGSKLTGANLNGTHLMSAHLENADLEGATLMRAHLDNTYFVEANIEKSVFEDARLINTKFDGCTGSPYVNERTFLDVNEENISINAFLDNGVSEMHISETRLLKSAKFAVSLFKKAIRKP